MRHAAVVVYLPDEPSSIITTATQTSPQGAVHKEVPLDEEVCTI